MNIDWKVDSLTEINALSKGTLLEHIDIQITSFDKTSITGTMPVDHRTVQPHKMLHGGASVALAESLGSLASNLSIDLDKFYAAGLEINANHVRPVKSGKVIGTATAVHLGKSTHIWDIKIHDDNNKLVCVSRLTMAILKK